MSSNMKFMHRSMSKWGHGILLSGHSSPLSNNEGTYFDGNSFEGGGEGYDVYISVAQVSAQQSTPSSLRLF